MTKKTSKPTLAGSKAAPLNRRKASTRTPLASASTLNDTGSSLPPPVESAGLAAPPGTTGVAPARGQAKRLESVPRRRVVSAAPRSTSRVNRPALGVDVPALSKLTAARTASGPEPTHDEIATRAYFISLSRNGTPGSPEQDWQLALSQLRRERRRS